MKAKNEINNYSQNPVSDVIPKEKKKAKQKQKIIIAICSAILVIVLAIAGWYLYERNINKWELKTTEVTVEYGENVSINIDDLVDTKTYININNDNTTIEAKDIQYDENDYLAIGEYDIEVAHKIEYKFFGLSLFSADDVKKATLIISDTVAPVFDEESPTEIQVYKDCEIENPEETFKATDLASIKITIDLENVDYSTVGEYTTNVYATDASGNAASLEIKIKVLEPSVTLDKTSLKLTIGKKAAITAAVKGKDKNVEWSSSDESVAKVENGTVTAVKAGTATITAKANDVKAACKVTVNSTNNSSKSTTSSSPSSTKSISGGSSSSGSSSSSSSSSSTTTTSAYWCTEGGSHHIIDVGLGWYSSYNAARQAGLAYIGNSGSSGSWEVQECDCGKYTVYVKID